MSAVDVGEEIKAAIAFMKKAGFDYRQAYAVGRSGWMDHEFTKSGEFYVWTDRQLIAEAERLKNGT